MSIGCLGKRSPIASKHACEALVLPLSRKREHVHPFQCGTTQPTKARAPDPPISKRPWDYEWPTACAPPPGGLSFEMPCDCVDCRGSAEAPMPM